MEKWENIDINEDLVELIAAFEKIEDMIICLTGYIQEVISIAVHRKEYDLEYIFSETILSKRLIKEVSKLDTLEEMESCLKEYCRIILGKAIDLKGKRLSEQWFSFSKSDRYDMLEKAGVEVDRNPKGRRRMNTFVWPCPLATSFGTVTYKRNGIVIPTLNNSKRYYSPIDDCLNLLSGIHYPKSVLVQIGKLITKMSYRQTASALNDLGIIITQATVWNLVRDVIFPRIFDLEKARTIHYLLGKEDEIGTEKERVSTLFVEWDGVWLSLDNTKDKSQKTGKKKEMKLGKAYIGWEKRYGIGKKSSYRTVGTKYIAGFEAPEILREMLNGKIHEVFDYANVKQIIVGGDGAKWIFQDYDIDGRVILQLDMFHIKQRVNRCIKDVEMKKKINKLIEKDQYLNLVEMLRDDIDKRIRTDNVKKEQELLEYLDNNFAALKRYQKVTIVKIEESLEARNLGTMESSVRQVIGRRMKMSAWSLQGARAMATMLCLDHEGKLEEVLSHVLDRNYEFKYDEINLSEFIQNFKNGQDLEQIRKGKEANQKIIAKGKYLAAMTNTDINLKKIIEMNQTVGKYIPEGVI